MTRGRRGKPKQGTGRGDGELPDRVCGAPDCEARATSRSMFCTYHQRTALGAEGERELQQLTREMERMARITDARAKEAAVGKFRARVEQGDFALLFSRSMQDSLDQAAEDAELRTELGAVRLAMARALQEIDDPTQMSMAISRLANASARTMRANTARKREERQRG